MTTLEAYGVTKKSPIQVILGLHKSLSRLEERLDRQHAEAVKLEREAGELARQLSESREAICSLLKDMEGCAWQ